MCSVAIWSESRAAEGVSDDTFYLRYLNIELGVCPGGTIPYCTETKSVALLEEGCG